MGHKTNDQPPSVYDLFMKYSKARTVKAHDLVHSGGIHRGRIRERVPTGNEMWDLDALRRHANKYAHNR